MTALREFTHFLEYLLLVACACLGTIAQTSGPTREPILRVETGTHTSIITRIGVDSANRYLVSASIDKTLRVWELSSGRLLRVIRVPIGDGDKGKLHAVAVSPDGATIATGGWTVDYSEKATASLYLFDRESGKLSRRIAGIPSKVTFLCYSPDGKYLAATFGDRDGVHSGLRVYRTTDYALVGEDRDYGDRSWSVDIDSPGRLATTSYDGFVRLYTIGQDGSLHLKAKQSSPLGRHPYDARFSPDGTRLAVGFDDSTKVAVLSSAGLTPLYEPATTGVDNGDLSKVAWSADGKTLYAGGKASDAAHAFLIRAWSDGGRGQYRDIAAAADAIMHIVPLNDGGVVYGTFDASLGMIDAGDKVRTFSSPAIADYRDNLQGFLLAPDAKGAGFAYEQFGKAGARFSLADRKLDIAPSDQVNWKAPDTEDSDLRVTDWKNATAPKLNGKPLKLEQYETSRSLALAPKRDGFLLGAAFFLRSFDRNGTERWRVPAPGATWAVNISADGRLAVAAYGDGTIRWYRMSDGVELLAFFPSKDQKRWILWTPAGYYDSSPGAEGLIGWHVNNGQDTAADFFPLKQFQEMNYRPDVVSRVLTTLDETTAVTAANAERGSKTQAADVEEMAPPVVDIISPADGAKLTAGEITVKYRVRSPTGDPVTGIMAMADGKTVAVEGRLTLNVGKDGVEREIKFRVPEGTSLISLLATNRNAPSSASVVQVRTTADRGAEIVGVKPPAALHPPKLYVLAIGVGRYGEASGLPQLSYPAKDAADFAAAFKKQEGHAYEKVELKVLPDATHDDVVDGLEWIARTATAKDVAMIFLAGHGITDGAGSYYFMPSDAKLDQPKRRGVLFDEIENTLIAIKGRKVLFVDTCHSGAVLGRRGVIDINGIANKINDATSGVAVFTASMGNESAEESSKWKNGAFTCALLEALAGKADYDGSGEVSFSMLDHFITKRVRELTSNRQTPTATKPLTVPEFLVAALR
jgi:WD40 repeat protein